MPGNDSTNNRLSEAQRNNSFRSDSENNIRNASLSGAGRNSEESGLYSSPKRTGITDQSPTESIKSKITDGLKNIKGEEDSINNKINSNINEINSRNASPSNLKSSAPKSTNGGLTPKQQLAKKGIEIAAKHINPALGAAVKSKTGQRILNAVLQKKNMFASPLGLASIIPNPLKTEDKENITQDENKEENRFGSVSITISKRLKRRLIPIGAACALVAFGCCVIIVAAYAYNGILGIDLSSQISMEELNPEVTDSNILKSLSNDGQDSNINVANGSIIDVATEVIEHYEGVGCQGQQSVDGDDYIACWGGETTDTGEKIITIGKGVTNQEMSFFQKYGINSISEGQRIPIETVDNIKDDIIKYHYDTVVQALENAGINDLKDYQISVLIVRSYNCGPGSVTNSFIPAYLKYKGKYNLNDMYSSNDSIWTESMNRPNYANTPGDAPGLYRRRVGEWKLFTTGEIDYMESGFDAGEYSW